MSRVLLVGPLLKSGGVSRFINDLLIAEIGYDISLFNTARPAKPHTSKGAVGYRTIFAAGVGWAIRNCIITGSNILRFPVSLLVSRAVMVHIATSSHWSFWESSLYLLFSKLFGRQVVLHFLGDFHTFFSSTSHLEKTFIVCVLRASDKVFVLSEGVRQIILPFVDNKRVDVLPSSVQISDFKRKNIGTDKTKTKVSVLFMGGNSGIRKGINDLGAAIPLVLANCTNVEFLLCGSGDVSSAYVKLEEKGLAGSIKYLGWVNDSMRLTLLSSAQIFVLPSYSEGMPYGIIEAMAAGLAIVATNIGSIPEIVLDGENGLLSTPGDVLMLSKNIISLAKDPVLIRKMSEANIARASEQFSTNRNFQMIRLTYDALLGIS